MFPPLNSDPAGHLDILQPGSDPLIDDHTRGAGAPASGRPPFRPERDLLRDRADSRMAPCGRSGQRPAPRGTGAPGGRRADRPGAPRTPVFC
jgi:hypothetical protein